MWIVKAIFFGLAIFVFGSVTCITSNMGPFTSNKAKGFSMALLFDGIYIRGKVEPRKKPTFLDSSCYYF